MLSAAVHAAMPRQTHTKHSLQCCFIWFGQANRIERRAHSGTKEGPHILVQLRAAHERNNWQRRGAQLWREVLHLQFQPSETGLNISIQCYESYCWSTLADPAHRCSHERLHEHRYCCAQLLHTCS